MMDATAVLLSRLCKAPGSFLTVGRVKMCAVLKVPTLTDSMTIFAMLIA
jgi:hypothetical protein